MNFGIASPGFAGPNPAVRDLLQDPAWKASDLGHPIPDSPHACLVCLPTWDSVLGYEEQRPEVVDVLQAGYPRFFLHPKVTELFNSVERAVGRPGERAAVFPTSGACERARRFVEGRDGVQGRVLEVSGLWALMVPDASYPAARTYWRHTGEVVSSRQAEDHGAGQLLPDTPPDGFRATLAATLEVPTGDAFILESGMAATFVIYRILTARQPGRPTLQVCFPYVDALKVQEHFGTGVDFVPGSGGEDFEVALESIRSGHYAAVFTEIPSNPLLTTPDLARLSDACRESGTPLVVDDTVASHANLAILPLADVVTTSLTKWVSGVGDVLAGSIKVNRDARHAEELRAALEEEIPGGTRLYPGDARVLARNAAGFRQRVRVANANGEQVAEFLAGHPAVAEVRYPKFVDRAAYEALLVDGGGYGGLVSFTLAAPGSTPAVYDALPLTKGPSLGTEYSLACPYTMLAHYEELAWAESCGVSRHLLRLSVGMEDPGTLEGALTEALAHA